MGMNIRNELIDEVTGKKIPFTIECNNGKMYISFDGYGDCCSKDGYGEPLVVDFFDNKLQILVYADINQEDPTHKVDMAGAKENKRKVNA